MAGHSRRQLAWAVLGCAAAAALIVVAAGRPWVAETVARPAPLPDETVSQSGGDLAAWLPAVGWVALAGAGALVATRGRVRQVVGVLLALAGLGAVLGVSVAGRQAVGDGGTLGWPVVALVSAVAVLAIGVLTVGRAAHWPAMGARYERGRARREQPGTGAERSSEQMWQALDRGEDPTT